MKADELKSWMEQTDKTIIDVASITELAPQTVRNFLNGQKVSRRTQRAIARLIHPKSLDPAASAAS